MNWAKYDNKYGMRRRDRLELVEKCIAVLTGLSYVWLYFYFFHPRVLVNAVGYVLGGIGILLLAAFAHDVIATYVLAFCRRRANNRDRWLVKVDKSVTYPIIWGQLYIILTLPAVLLAYKRRRPVIERRVKQ